MYCGSRKVEGAVSVWRHALENLALESYRGVLFSVISQVSLFYFTMHVGVNRIRVKYNTLSVVEFLNLLHANIL